MKTRQELADAATRRLDAAIKVKRTEQAMAVAHKRASDARAAHLAAVSEQRAAVAAYDEIEKQLSTQEVEGS